MRHSSCTEATKLAGITFGLMRIVVCLLLFFKALMAALMPFDSCLFVMAALVMLMAALETGKGTVDDAPIVTNGRFDFGW